MTTAAVQDSNLKEALAAWQNILGEEFVCLKSSEISPYQQSTIPYDTQISAVLLPQTIEQIQKIVKIAADYRVPLYPISCGNNWGYGSAKPVSGQNVILDLRRLSKIVELNRELGYVVVEPGVTQGQLSDFLLQANVGLQMDPSGAGPSASVLGNIAERGYGIGQYGDHFGATCGMEIILADGSILRTGFGHFAHSRISHIHRWGVGPYLDGLFTQSNLGIIVRLGVWLQRIPERFEVCLFSFDRADQLGAVVETTRELLFDRVFPASVNFVSRNRALTTRMSFPGIPGSDQRLSDDQAGALARKVGIRNWNGMAPMFGSAEMVQAMKKQIRRRLQGQVDKLIFFSEVHLNLIRRFPKICSWIGGVDAAGLLKSLAPLFDALRGKPTEVSMLTPYWRNQHPAASSSPINPARDQCGLIWITPVVPMCALDIDRFLTGAGSIVENFGFDFCPTFTTVTSRAVDCSLPILFDKRSQQQSNQANQCYRHLFQFCTDNGYVPYRVGAQSMELLVDQNDTYWQTVQRIKNALDPKSVLAPGRYSVYSKTQENKHESEEQYHTVIKPTAY